MKQFLAWIWVFVVVPAAWAHGLSGQCLAHDDQVTVQAYFDTDEPAVGASVRVLDNSGSEIAAGKTDDTGAWTFANPGAGRYRVVIDAGAGHRTELKLDLAGSRYERETQASRGPSRATFTGYTLGKIALGLLAIAALAVTARMALRRRRTRPESAVE